MTDLGKAEGIVREFIREKWEIGEGNISILSSEPRGDDWIIGGRASIPKEKTLVEHIYTKFSVTVDIGGKIKSYKFEPP